MKRAERIVRFAAATGLRKDHALIVDFVNQLVARLKMQCGADLQATIKRSDFGVKYALPALGDDVTLRIPVEAIKD